MSPLNSTAKWCPCKQLLCKQSPYKDAISAAAMALPITQREFYTRHDGAVGAGK